MGFEQWLNDFSLTIAYFSTSILLTNSDPNQLVGHIT